MKNLRDRIPDWAKDLRLNLDAIPRIDSLSPRQLWGTVLASAIATRNAELTAAAGEEAALHLDAAALRAARTAAALMGMNNVYYRFTHLVSNHEYATMPARLRMQGIADPGVDRVDFELWCLAVSAINGCGKCLEAHEGELRKHGASTQQVQDAVRVASIIHAIGPVLEAEPVTAGALSQ